MQKQYRLKSRSSFNYIYKKGKSVRTGVLSLVYVPSRFQSKIGFSVGKKVGGSVQRNKVKRRLREIFRDFMPDIENNHNYVVIAREGAFGLTYQELKENAKRLFLKAGKWKSN